MEAEGTLTIPARIVTDQYVSDSARAVFMLLCLIAPGGTIRISISELSADLPHSRPTVIRALKALEDRGYISIERAVNQAVPGLIALPHACKETLQAPVDNPVDNQSACKESRRAMNKRRTGDEQAEQGSDLQEHGRSSKNDTTELTGDEKKVLRSSRSLEPKTFSVESRWHGSEEMRLTKALGDSIRRRDPKTKYDDEKQVVHIDRLHRIDGRSFEEIERIITWLDRGVDRDAEFWRANVLCASTFRRQFPKLFAKAPKVSSGAVYRKDPCAQCAGQGVLLIDGQDGPEAVRCEACGGTGRNKAGDAS